MLRPPYAVPPARDRMKLDEIYAAIQKLEQRLNGLAPSRSRSIALTKLEEVWHRALDAAFEPDAPEHGAAS